MVNYDKNYYIRHSEGAYRSAKIILNTIKEYLTPHSIIDFGCGTGEWLEVAEETFDSKILGVDQHDFKNANMRIKNCDYAKFDITKPFFGKQKYDLVICLEVAEHIDNYYTDIFIDNLCRHGDIILFSAALPMQGGTGHVNERPCTYWQQIFEKKSFYPIDWLRPRLWNDKGIEIWYRNNILMYFEKSKFFELKNKIIPQSYPLNVIHPEMLERIIEEINK